MSRPVCQSTLLCTSTNHNCNVNLGSDYRAPGAFSAGLGSSTAPSGRACLRRGGLEELRSLEAQLLDVTTASSYSLYAAAIASTHARCALLKSPHRACAEPRPRMSKLPLSTKFNLRPKSDVAHAAAGHVR